MKFQAPRDVAFRCSCGTIRGTLRGVAPSTGSHAVCYCADCRAAEVFSGQPDPAPDPVGLFQTSPDRVSFRQGHDQLAVFAFGPKNLLRWHAKCCGSIMFNTMRNPKVSFASIRTNLLEDQESLGPVIASAFIATASGKPTHKGLHRFIWGAFQRIVGARLSGRWKDTPFFNTDTLEPVRPVQVVDKAKRAQILASLR